MKRRKWLYLVLIVLCLAAFVAYRAMDRMWADTGAPSINMDAAQLQISVTDMETSLLQGVSAVDEKDGDVTASLVVESTRLLDQNGTISVTYAAFDQAGNVAKAQREVLLTDYTSPRFTLDSPLVFAQNSNFDVLSVLGAEDMLDGDLQYRIRATSLDDASIDAVGTHQIQFRVTNSLGDTVEQVFPVEVYPAGTYTASLTLTDYLIYLPVGASFSAKDYLGSFSVNRDTVSLRDGLPAHYTLQTQGEVNTQEPGVYALSYTVTYTADSVAGSGGERTYDGYSKLIVVVEG